MNVGGYDTKDVCAITWPCEIKEFVFFFSHLSVEISTEPLIKMFLD